MSTNPLYFTIQADHPSLAGHFPDHPVVPGVVILNYALAALAGAQAQAITGIRRIKFLAQVLPGQTLRLEIGLSQPGGVAFKCWLDTVVAVEGQVMLAG